jgi:N-glycosylase/DNA lyase
MNERAVYETFEALFALTDLRQLFRETKPLFNFSEKQREGVQRILERVRKSLDIIEKETLK